MTITNLAGAAQFALQSAIGGYTDEAYTTEKKLSGTALVSSNPLIDTNTETFIGQMRWFKPLNPVVNVASLTDSADGSKTSYGSDFLKYIKTVRTHGADKINMQQVVTQQDGLAKIGRDFAETRRKDEHDALLAVLRGVAVSEALYGAGTASGSAGLGGQTFENDPASKRYGFYVDLASAKPVVAQSTTAQGAIRAEGFVQAMGMAYKDYEPPYAYLVTSPLVLSSLRSANLVDQDRVTDGNIEFDTIFNGKLRLIVSRANQSLSSAELAKINTMGGVDITGTYTSFIVLPGALAMEPLAVPDEVEITRDGNKYKGGGLTTVWYRWGYVIAPAGYDWVGAEDAFPGNDTYQMVYDTTATAAWKSLATCTDATVSKGIWARKTSSALSLGILPIFHS